MIKIHNSSDGVSFAIKIHPHARKNAVTGELGDALKVSITAPPAGGKANQACIEFLASLLQVPRSSVSITSGLKSRKKTIRVTGLTSDEVQKRLTHEQART
jgi:hypothetical protein